MSLGEHNRLQIARNDGTAPAEQIATMTMMEYRYQLTYLQEDGSRRDTSRKALCYELRSDGALPYTWAMWSLSPFGHFGLFSLTGGKPVLTWVDSSDVCFAEVSQPKDRLVDFMQYVGKKQRDSYYRIPVGQLIPETRKWGVNALYFDIFVQSVEKDDAGRFKVTIAGPAHDRLYVLVQDAGEWRLEK